MKDTVALPADAVHCISGLVYQVLRPGQGDDRPRPDDVVQVLLAARNDAARSFDPAAESGPPRSFVVKDAVAGLAEAFQLMGIGQQMRVWFPADPARHQEKILSFDIEMVNFIHMTEKPPLRRELTSPRQEP